MKSAAIDSFDQGSADPDCELCAQAGGELLWRDNRCRVVLVNDLEYPGFCRVIWNGHVREMTDLDTADRQHCMRVVLAVEQALRKAVRPHKINLASFGNLTPHVHWHVIPRHLDDAHFPQAVWGERQRDGSRNTAVATTAELNQALTTELLSLLSDRAR